MVMIIFNLIVFSNIKVSLFSIFNTIMSFFLVFVIDLFLIIFLFIFSFLFLLGEPGIYFRV